MELQTQNIMYLENNRSTVMTKCGATTNRGLPCPIEAEPERLGFCHVHDPNGVYRTQLREKKTRGKNKTKITEKDIRDKIFMDISKIPITYSDGSPKSPTAILVEALAIAKGK